MSAVTQIVNPVVDGDRYTFLYRGEANAVRLRHWVFGLANSPAFIRGDGDEWRLTLELPPQSRIEYKLEVDRNDRTDLIEDPFNPLHARDPFGANSVIHTAGYETPEWSLADAEARPGTIERHRRWSAALQRDVDISLYRPARFRPSRRYPLLVVHDGDDYLRYSSMQTVLDNLIHRLEVAEMVVAFSNPVERLVEYADYEPHARHVVTELVPWLERELPLDARPSSRGIMGASFGAVASFSTVLRYPGFFGRLIVQSGSFAFSDIGMSERGPLFAPAEKMINAYRARPIACCEQVFMSCGRYESLIHENRALLPVLQSSGMEVRYAEARDGHNWENWRDRLRDGLAWSFPGPFWMVYE